MTDVFDRHGALQRVDNDTELYRELVVLFFADLDDTIGKLSLALQKGQAETVTDIAHSIKSALGNLGAMQAYQCAAAIEKSARDGDLDAAREAFESFPGLIDAYAAAAAEFQPQD